MEHTKSKRVAQRIAMDYLKEFPTYYTDGLIPMERRLRRMKKSKPTRKRRTY